MRRVRRIFIKTAVVAVAICLVATSLIVQAALPSAPPVRNIILMIGDGMGVAAIRATQLDTKGPDARLSMETLPYSGLVTTHSLNSSITDSAAAGTALATGYKTNNRMISMLPDGTILRTVLEYAESKGKSTGLVVTSRITDATPAAFASHVMNREWEGKAPYGKDIALQMLYAGVEVLLGGGRMEFLPTALGGVRIDERNLISEAFALHYTYVETRDDMLAVHQGNLLGLFTKSRMDTVQSGLRDGVHGTEPSLVQMTSKAIELLDQDPEGFFLMVEGSLIDLEAHDNDAEGVIAETADFDAAVGVAIAFASRHPSTLLIVTADHETGGMAINGLGYGGEGSRYGFVFTSTGHTGTMVAVFASGPPVVAGHFTGVMDNTDIGRIMFAAICRFPSIDHPRRLQFLDFS